MNLCIAHHLIGLRRLMNGDRAGTREHFQKTVETRFYAAISYPYARACLARLNRDESWPKWISFKK